MHRPGPSPKFPVRSRNLWRSPPERVSRPQKAEIHCRWSSWPKVLNASRARPARGKPKTNGRPQLVSAVFRQTASGPRSGAEERCSPTAVQRVSRTSNPDWKGERTKGSALDKCHLLKQNGVSDMDRQSIFVSSSQSSARKSDCTARRD